MIVLDSWYEALEDKECPDSSRMFLSGPDIPSSTPMHGTTGSMRIPWSDVINLFDGIYANWNPAAWASSLSFHGKWKAMAENETSKVFVADLGIC